MMVTRITVALTPMEREALHVLAERELRDIRAQAALIIRQELKRLGFSLQKSSDPVAHKADSRQPQDSGAIAA